MALKPAHFLKGIGRHDRDADRLGLTLWLDLESRGFIETELPYTAVREAFEEALRRDSPPPSPPNPSNPILQAIV
jgi:hypothetical protein